MMSKLLDNAESLEQDLSWFNRVMEARFKIYFPPSAQDKAKDQGTGKVNVLEIRPPDLSRSSSEYARFVAHYNMTFAERLALVLSLVPHIRPQLLDAFFMRNQLSDRRYTEFGGISRA